MEAVVASDSAPVAISAAEGEERALLKGAAVNGIAANLASQLVLFGLRFAYQITIARLLLPNDFGLVAMITPVIMFVQLFADLGLTQATIQMKEISQEQLSFLFWLNVAAGVLLSGLCALCAPLVAQFYGDPRAAGVMVASGAMFAVGGFFSQHLALMTRQMRFRSLAAVNVISFLAGSACGIGSALIGAGYWALVVNQLGTSIAMLVLAWSFSRWLPGPPSLPAEFKQLLQFGGHLTGFNIVNFFSRNSANVLLGRFAGEQPLGLYDRATKLMLVPFMQVCAPFGNVALPLLSRTQDQPDVYRMAYRRMLETILLLVYPGLVFMIVNSHALTAVALGARWVGVAPVFAILGVDMFVAPIGSSTGWLFVSQGRTSEMRNWGLVTSAIFIASFVCGLPWGPQGVAAGYAAAGLIEILLLLRCVTRIGPVGVQDILGLLAPFLFAVAVAFPVAHRVSLVELPLVQSLLLGAVCAYASFLLALAVLPRGRRILLEVSDQIRGLALKVIWKA